MKRITLRGEACVETLAVLILMANADGRIDETERAGIREAAGIFNLTTELRARVDAMLAEPLPIDQLLIEDLTAKERAFAFVAAVWMSGLDKDVDSREQALIHRLASLFEIDNERKAELVQVARDIEPGRRPETRWADELVTLFKAIPARLEGATRITFGLG